MTFRVQQERDNGHEDEPKTIWQDEVFPKVVHWPGCQAHRRSHPLQSAASHLIIAVNCPFARYPEASHAIQRHPVVAGSVTSRVEE